MFFATRAIHLRATCEIAKRGTAQRFYIFTRINMRTRSVCRFMENMVSSVPVQTQ